MSWPLIDILKLHHEKDTEKSALRVIGSLELNKMFDELCKKIIEKHQFTYKDLAKDFFKVNKNTVQNWRGSNKKYSEGHPISIWAIDKLLDSLDMKRTHTHRKLIKSINFIQCGRVGSKVKAQIYLTPILARLCGAHAADGSLYPTALHGPLSARWDIGDGEKENIKEIVEWIEELFDIKLKIQQKGNMAYVWTNRQILSRYLVQIFDFPIGPKSETVSEPRIFSKNDERLLTPIAEKQRDEIKLEFAKEVVNFDGHSTVSGKVVTIGLGSNSKQLLTAVENTFRNNGVNFHIYEKKILTTSINETRKVFSFGVFRGQKKKKIERLLSGDMSSKLKRRGNTQ